MGPVREAKESPVPGSAPPNAAGPSLATRLRVWRAGLGARPADYAARPEPRSIGSAAIGRQICEGIVQIGGRRHELNGLSLWDLPRGGPSAGADRHGFVWLDDLAAAGSRRAAVLSRLWLADWLARYDSGRGMGWRPDVAARRLVRWINHAAMLEDGLDPATRLRFRRGLTRHVAYLARTWHGAPPGVPTFEALCGLIQGGLALKGMEGAVRPGIKALEALCREGIGADGSLPSRNPEDLLTLFVMLVWCETAMTEVGLLAQTHHRAAIARIAPVLRGLRHADGALARFHGGGCGVEGRLDAALAAARSRTPPPWMAMGYARLARGRSTVILDGAAPPGGAAAATAHASTLALEMTVGRRPMLVNCGSGISFGREWEQAARATAAHSTLAPDGFSAGRFRDLRRGRVMLTEAPKDVRCDPAPERGPASLSASHDGFAASQGLIHLRRLDLGEDGAILSGEDILTAASQSERRRFSVLAQQRLNQGLGFTIRFHLHPDVTAQMGEDRNSVMLVLKSGEVWQFRHVSKARIGLDPSVYLEKTRPQPTPTRQIVLEAKAMEFTTTIRWSLSRLTQPDARQRDVYRDDMSIT